MLINKQANPYSNSYQPAAISAVQDLALLLKMKDPTLIREL
ncbi:hypothetical protein [Lentilactobacillus kosonis]|uniref:Uncharacterized protein n=1 Tax=Lentilactobacillus kosonis TaxID=2810561 RepID=A0A401FLS2_9LACO|nr:hypothetical protein [Lentilactobacillus kosonis]GAY73320.1 hypothetical protein NBRC111893_1466 [Lentilactobacillus kosonis]